MITPEDRQYLDSTFSRYGSRWAGGLAALEANFELRITKTEEAYSIAGTSRGPDAVVFAITITRKDGRMMGGVAAVPDGPELTATELAAVDSHLRRLKELWLIGPGDGKLFLKRLDKGVEEFRGGLILLGRKLKLKTRRSGDVANLYLVEDPRFGEIFSLSLHLTTGDVLGARWVEIHANGSRRLEPATVDFLDRALRKNGDFGVYGNVTEGLRALVNEGNLEIQLREDESKYSVYIAPRDGHGHDLGFSVDKVTGAISDVCAGEILPDTE